MICKDMGYDKDRGGEWCVDRVGLAEGRESYDDAVADLQETPVLDELEWSEALAASC